MTSLSSRQYSNRKWMLTMDDFPVKDKKRARRRQDKMRMRQKAEKIAKKIFNVRYFNEEVTLDWSIKNAEHLKSCSCHMCGNRRKYDGKTRQEIKADLQMEDYK